MSNITNKYNEDLISKLINYVSNGGSDSGITLSEKDEEILQRVRLADEHLRSKKYTRREYVVNVIMEQFGVSRDTAYKTIVIAERIFSSSMPLNKKYLVHCRIEKLMTKIDELYTKGDDLNAGNLEKTLQKYIENYPDEVQAPSPKNIIFNIQNNNYQSSVSVEEAFRDAETIALKLTNE